MDLPEIARMITARMPFEERTRARQINRTWNANVNSMDRAARNGHIEAVKWLYENRDKTRSTGCTSVGIMKAAANGHLGVLKWLHETHELGWTRQVMDGAAQHGQLDVVKWLHVNRKEGCTTNAMDFAALCGHLDVLKWLYENRTEGCTMGIRAAPPVIIQWLDEKCIAMDVLRIHSGMGGLVYSN